MSVSIAGRPETWPAKIVRQSKLRQFCEPFVPISFCLMKSISTTTVRPFACSRKHTSNHQISPEIRNHSSWNMSGRRASIPASHRARTSTMTGAQAVQRTAMDLVGFPDSYGFGWFPGQYGMVVLSRFPIHSEAVRTFQKLLWSEMPDARRPMDPETHKPWHSDESWNAMRLSSKSHGDVPIDVEGTDLHILASHPTPPAFDGPEDRNGCRNADEIRLGSTIWLPNNLSGFTMTLAAKAAWRSVVIFSSWEISTLTPSTVLPLPAQLGSCWQIDASRVSWCLKAKEQPPRVCSRENVTGSTRLLQVRTPRTFPTVPSVICVSTMYCRHKHCR
jgi:hypothetical protein